MGGKKRFRSISATLRATVLVFCLILILSVLAILRIFYSHVLLQNTVTQLRYEDEILANAIEYRADTTNSSCNTIILHLNNAPLQLDENNYPSLSTSTQKTIYQSMVNTFAMFYDAVQICVLWDNGTCFYQSRSENYTMYPGEDALLQELDALPITREGYWLTSIKADCLIQGEGLYFAKVYADIDSGQKRGYIVIRLDDIFDVLNISSGYRSFYLFDAQGQMIQTTGEAPAVPAGGETDCQTILAGLPVQNGISGKVFSGTQRLGNGWTLVSVSDLTEITRNLNVTTAYILAISALVLTAMFLIMNAVIHRVTTPVKQLSQHMVSFPSTLPAPITNVRHTGNEVGILIDHFNQMAEKNADLVDSLLEEKRQQRHLELALLQAQIKPHFLYNTLDTIYCLSCIGRADEASHTTKLLSDYYRLVLSKGTEEVPLAQELETVRKYLEIQTVRYSNVLSHTIDMEESVAAVQIPKLTLQPLVENAIYHGIKPAGRPGHVRITATRQDGVVTLRVADNGVGMQQEAFRALLEQTGGEGEGFGLRNVADRLRLYYGDGCRVCLEPRGTGTCIAIHITLPGAGEE